MGSKLLTWNEAMNFCKLTQGIFARCMDSLRIIPVYYKPMNNNHMGLYTINLYSLSDIKRVKKYYEKNKHRWMPK